MSMMPGLRAMIQSINREEFRAFLEANAPTLCPSIDWTAEKDAYPSSAFDVLTDDRQTTQDLREKIFPKLYEIHLVAENRHNGTTYRKRIFGNHEAQQLWLKRFGLQTPDIDTMAMWMQVHANGLFQEVLSNILMSSKESNGGTRYFLKSSYEDKIAPRPFEEFKDALKLYLRQESGVHMHASVERLDLAKMIRFTVYTDPFPKNEHQFKESEKDDELDTRLSRKVDCFHFSLQRVRPGRQAYFNFKCDFLKTQRDWIATMFAKLVLNTDLDSRMKPKHNLNLFRMRPEVFDFTGIDGFERLAYEGMKVARQSGQEKQDVLSWRYGAADFYDRVERQADNTQSLDGSCEVQELYLSITLRVGPVPAQGVFAGFDDERRTVTYSVVVRRSADWSAQPVPSDCEVRKIDEVLERMGLQDISGDKVLKASVRT